MMELRNIRVVLDDKRILGPVDLDWKKGESIAILGANGAGKSTLLKVLATLQKPSFGEMRFSGGMQQKEWRQSIGTVFPETFLYDALTGIENLIFYAKLYAMKNPNHVEERLGEVGLWSVRDEPVHTYSKGMKQRLSIARALVHQPAWLLLDEPFDGLDMESVSIVEQLLSKLRMQGIGWVLVSHDMEQAWKNCDRALLLHQGRFCEEANCDRNSYEPFLLQARRWMKESPYAVS